jgi:hypothetical protein
MTWPITWPDEAAADAAGVTVKRLCEIYAVACMTALTLHRVGGSPVTIMPVSMERVDGYYVGHIPLPDEYPLGNFYPGMVYPSAQYLREEGHTIREVQAIDLPGPVGAVTEVVVGGEVLDPLAYRVENGRYLIRMDSGSWPTESGDNFRVTYFNSHPVDEMGSYAAGVMAAEWLKLLTNAKGGCRLPRSVTNIQRQGLTMELARGMFPDGVTGMPEVDAYIMLLNPFALKIMPRVYSLDLPEHRQVTG